MQICHLEIPAELVGIIAHHLVCDAGLAEAWKLRGVCVSFRHAITDEIIMRQPGTVFLSYPYSQRNLNLRLMPLVLACRVRKRHDAYDVLPDRVERLALYLFQELGYTQREEKDRCIATICQNVCEVLGHWLVAQALWKDKAIKWCASTKIQSSIAGDKDMGIHEQVFAAALAQEYSLFRKLLRKLDDFNFDQHYQNPLRLANRMNDVELGRIYVKYLQSRKLSAKAVAHLGLNNILEQACRSSERQPLFNMLLDYLTETDQLSKGAYNTCLEEAVNSHDLTMIRKILKVCPKTTKVPMGIFSAACSKGDLDRVQLLIEEGDMDLNSGYLYMLPLHVAIRSGKLDVIGAVLDAGADINLTSYNAPHTKEIVDGQDSPLQYALTQSVHTVYYLVKRGALVPPEKKWWGRRISKKLYNVLKEARESQTGETLESYEDAKETNSKRAVRSCCGIFR